MTTVLPRGARTRRGGRRPGWVLLTALLVLAIVASSVLVFTSRVELLKLAVIVSLWAAVMAAFASVVYRRQSDADEARVRDLKLVYDLQLEREISARREYELSVESRLRQELAVELRHQAADEVAALRAELAVLRTNLEILFEADLSTRPALETERTALRAYSERPSFRPEDSVSQTTENPIIDVPEVGVPVGAGPEAGAGNRPRRERRERRESREQREQRGRREQRVPGVRGRAYPLPAQPGSAAQPDPWAAPGSSEVPVPAAPAHAWQPMPAEGEWLPAGAMGSHWAAESGTAAEFDQPASRPRRSRHAKPEQPSPAGRRRAEPRHAAQAAEAGPAQSAAAGSPPDGSPPSTPRHRSADDASDGGESAADLLARLHAGSPRGGRRRRAD